MVLDIWTSGKMDGRESITSYSPSRMGFVTFGTVKDFEAKDKIETFGLAARGSNQYDGTEKNAKFHSIITYGNGSINIQVSKPAEQFLWLMECS